MTDWTWVRPGYVLAGMLFSLVALAAVLVLAHASGDHPPDNNVPSGPSPDSPEGRALAWAAKYRPGWAIIAGPSCEELTSSCPRCNLTLVSSSVDADLGLAEWYNPDLRCPAGEYSRNECHIGQQ